MGLPMSLGGPGPTPQPLATAYNSTALLMNIRRRCFAPNAAALGTQDYDLLQLADAEIRTSFVPQLIASREEYYDWVEDLAITSSVDTYRIPYRAIHGKLREITRVDTQGNILNLNELRVEHISGPAPAQAAAAAFYIKGAYIVLWPSPSSSGDKLRLEYHFRPNRLVYATNCAVVQSVNTSTGVVTFTTTVPTGVFSSGLNCDFIRGTSPFEILAYDKPATAVSGSTITFNASDLPAGALAISAGDIVCLAEQTVIPQIPVDLHDVLAQRVANTVLRNIGQLDRLQAGEAALSQMQSMSAILMTPRVEGEVEVMINDAFFPGVFIP